MLILELPLLKSTQLGSPPTCKGGSRCIRTALHNSTSIFCCTVLHASSQLILEMLQRAHGPLHLLAHDANDSGVHGELDGAHKSDMCSCLSAHCIFVDAVMQ